MGGTGKATEWSLDAAPGQTDRKTRVPAVERDLCILGKRRRGEKIWAFDQMRGRPESFGGQGPPAATNGVKSGREEARLKISPLVVEKCMQGATQRGK